MRFVDKQLKKSTDYIGFIETLRAVAALSVLIFHFVCYYNGNKFIVQDESARSIAEHGAQGVELFYCISGFVIMFALSKNDYKVNYYGHYLLKRILRIIPVYWMTIVAIYSLEFVFGKVLWDHTLQLDWQKIFANAFFLVDLFEGEVWINPVFATLGVEFQFYIIVGLLFPLLKTDNGVKYGILTLWLVLGYFTINNYSVLVNGPFFIAGILLYDWYKSPESMLPKWSLFALVCYLSIVYSLDDTVIVVLVILCFVWLRPSLKPLNFIGNFSYSLYLTHGLFGGWLIYFTTYNESSAGWTWAMILLAVVSSLVGGYLFYWCFEKPAMRWSKSVRWGTKQLPK